MSSKNYITADYGIKIVRRHMESFMKLANDFMAGSFSLAGSQVHMDKPLDFEEAVLTAGLHVIGMEHLDGFEMDGGEMIEFHNQAIKATVNYVLQKFVSLGLITDTGKISEDGTNFYKVSPDQYIRIKEYQRRFDNGETV